MVRDVQSTESKVKAEIDNRSNIHLVHGDLDSYELLKVRAYVRLSGEISDH